MFLIVGLGNPGKLYSNNRHNIGYKILDNIREMYNFPEFSKKFKINHLIYASSSSVYGNNKIYPFSEKHGVNHPFLIGSYKFD